MIPYLIELLIRVMIDQTKDLFSSLGFRMAFHLNPEIFPEMDRQFQNKKARTKSLLSIYAILNETKNVSAQTHTHSL